MDGKFPEEREEGGGLFKGHLNLAMEGPNVDIISRKIQALLLLFYADGSAIKPEIAL